MFHVGRTAVEKNKQEPEIGNFMERVVILNRVTREGLFEKGSLGRARKEEGERGGGRHQCRGPGLRQVGGGQWEMRWAVMRWVEWGLGGDDEVWTSFSEWDKKPSGGFELGHDTES